VPGTPEDLLALGGPTVQVSSYDDYASAQRTVDFLSDNGFPVEQTAIVGTDLKMVENVLGRLTTARAALAGAASGAWFGLLIGLLIGIFSASAWWRVLIAAIVIGAVWGAIFGGIAHAATGGRRDFSSRTSLQAGHYAVNVGEDHAEEARLMLRRLDWNQLNMNATDRPARIPGGTTTGGTTTGETAAAADETAQAAGTAGSDRSGAHRAATEQAGTDQAGTERTGTDRTEGGAGTP
jgi:hypothetical protein